MSMSVVWAAIAVLIGAISLIAKSFLTSFSRETARVVVALESAEELAKATEKGKNLATKEDIQEITRLQESVRTTFQMEMEHHKAEIGKISKSFELYTVKKHEHYPELYKNFEVCIRKVKDLEWKGKKLGLSIDFTNFNKEDITIFMSDKSFHQSDKERILSDWDKNKLIAIRDVEHILHGLDYIEAEKSYEVAENSYYLNRLFFSDEVSEIANILLSNVYALLVNTDPDSQFITDKEYSEKLRKENEELNKKIDKLSFELYKTLKEELKAEATNE